MSRMEYLTLAQLRESRAAYRPDDLDAPALRKSIAAVQAGRMWQERPPMDVQFDGVYFRAASHLHRIEAAVQADSPYCEFYCQISGVSA